MSAVAAIGPTARHLVALALCVSMPVVVLATRPLHRLHAGYRSWPMIAVGAAAWIQPGDAWIDDLGRAMVAVGSALLVAALVSGRRRRRRLRTGKRSGP